MLARYKNCLIDLFKRIHELRRDPIGKRSFALEIQETLLKRIGRAEYFVKQIRIANGEIKTNISNRVNSREQSRALKKLFDAGETNIDQQKILISILRSVGDAVAFIYGDRWDLKQLALKESAGFITGKRGTRFERRILRRAFALGATVVMNDLTHTLRHGDITVFRPDLWPEGGSPFFLIEAKSGRGGNKARTKRQATAMKEIHEYLSTDKRSVAGGTFERISVKTFPEYHFEVITKLASNLRHGEICVEEIEPGLHYILLDCACDTNNMEQVLKRSFCGAARYFMSVNDMKSVHLAYYPFPLSIRDPETLFRFYNVEFVIFISVNIDHVNDVLSPFGLKIEVTSDDERPWQVLSVGKETSIEDGESFIGFRPLGQLGAEFVRLDWLIENVVVGPYEAIQRRRSELIQTKRQGFEEDGD